MRHSRHIVGVVGRKGGCGKTTVAVNLAGALAARGRRVVLVDADPQGSAGVWAAPGLLPFTTRAAPLATYPDDDQQQQAGIAWRQAVEGIDADYVILDAAPHLDASAGAICTIADLILLPCAPSALDVAALASAVAEVVRPVAGKRSPPPIIATLPVRVDNRTAAGDTLRDALKGMGLRYYRTGLSARVAFADSAAAGQWIGDYTQKKSPAYDEAVALANKVEKELRRR